MNTLKILILFSMLLILSSTQAALQEDNKELFSKASEKERFAKDISYSIGKAWEKWQDAVSINDVGVESSQGLLAAGSFSKPLLKASDIIVYVSRQGRTQKYIDCIKIVAKALENGVRSWQRGYSHENIPFPQGSSCTYTLPLCTNIPVNLASGKSLGDREMTEEALYNYMLYNAPRGAKEGILIVFRSSSSAISECFDKWKSACYIAEIKASGGIAPQPAPIGTGPGPVRGAKGKDGRLKGTYFDGSLMYEKMTEYFKRH